MPRLWRIQVEDHRDIAARARDVLGRPEGGGFTGIEPRARVGADEQDVHRLQPFGGLPGGDRAGGALRRLQLADAEPDVPVGKPRRDEAREDEDVGADEETTRPAATPATMSARRGARTGDGRFG